MGAPKTIAGDDQSEGDGSGGTPGYQPPAVAWEESLEKAGIYAGCAKDEFGEFGEGCLAVPMSGGS